MLDVTNYDERIGRMIRNAHTASVIRATEQARALAVRPGCTDPAIGYDTVNLSLKLPPAEADELLRYIGQRTETTPV